MTGGQEGLSTGAAATIITRGRYTARTTRQRGIGRDTLGTFNEAARTRASLMIDGTTDASGIAQLISSDA
jgi:hypothetical protein